MLSFHAQLKVFLATAPCDLRMNFNGLWAAAQERLGEDPKGGALFVFGNRRHNRIKILYFDGTGVCVLAKRLEEGTFHWPQSAGEPGAKIRFLACRHFFWVLRCFRWNWPFVAQASQPDAPDAEGFQQGPGRVAQGQVGMQTPKSSPKKY
jgi:transposase